MMTRTLGTSTDFRAGAAFGLAASMGDRPFYLEGSLFTVLSTTFYAGLGASVGLVFAAVTPEKSIPVYELRTASSSVRLGVAPIATPARPGVTLTLRF
jgi:hypothetical protein